MNTEGITTNGLIYKLIGQAIGKIGAIGKDKKNAQQGFMYRGIDQVYNALNPVTAELGIFFCPEIIEQKREERQTKNGTVLYYTMLTIRYTAYAPDGSNVQLTVIGEGMDSGDKSSNKAMSVAMKYAMFQLFCIPTEEMKDPDADVYTDVLPKGTQAAKNQPQTDQKPAHAPQAVNNTGTAQNVNNTANQPVKRVEVTTADKMPQETQKPAEPETGAGYLKRKMSEMKAEFTDEFNFALARKELIEKGEAENVPSAVITLEQAKTLVGKMYERYAHLRKVS